VGAIQTTAVWYVFDEGRLQVSVQAARKKYRNLLARPQVMFFVIDRASPYRYLEIRGTAQLAEDPGYEVRDRILDRYGLDPARIDEAGTGRIAITIAPNTINTR
jgi:PPOX class probable F420-dependent enzyme